MYSSALPGIYQFYFFAALEVHFMPLGAGDDPPIHRYGHPHAVCGDPLPL
jgi:hypothetical protein